ncbi:hypothetical protein GCM10010378_70580 [Streptomyces viridochromogenes]
MDSVKSIVVGQQSQSVYKDVRQLARAAVMMVDDILNGRESEVDNGVSRPEGAIRDWLVWDDIPVDCSVGYLGGVLCRSC